MTERKTPTPTPSAPLKAFLGDKRGAKAELVEKLGISHAVLTNWFSRGIPRSRLMEVASYMGISAEKYLQLAGGTKQEGKMEGRLSEVSPGSDDLELLSELAKKWGSLPRGTKIAILALAQDVASFVERNTNEILNKHGASGQRADDNSVVRNFGLPQPTRPKNNRG